VAMAVDASSPHGSPDGSPDRRPASGRLAAGLGPRVRRYLDAVPGTDRSGEEADRVLRAAVDALLDLAHRTPGIDLTVSVGPSGGPAVRLHYTHEGLVAHRLNARGRASSREQVGPVFAESEVVSELASMLWSGEVETR
jgi:hypothetical protein